MSYGMGDDGEKCQRRHTVRGLTRSEAIHDCGRYGELGGTQANSRYGSCGGIVRHFLCGFGGSRRVRMALRGGASGSCLQRRSYLRRTVIPTSDSKLG